MLTDAALRRAVEDALALVRGRPGVLEAEVYAAATRSLFTRLNYTSHLPCNGVEEPKSAEIDGVGVRVVLDRADGPHIGFGAEPGGVSPDAAARALDKAVRSAVRDPEFRSLPRPTSERRSLADHHDPGLFAITDEGLVEAGWSLVTGGLGTFTASSRLADLAGPDGALRPLGLVLGGDLQIRQERVAIASSQMPGVQADQSAVMTAEITAMVEAHEAKGSGCMVSTRLADCTDEAGATAAAARAIAAIGGQRVRSGDYTVILGSQPVTDILTNLVLPACQAGSFYASSSPFLGKLGRRVAVPELSLWDHGALSGFAASRGITCEGLPTGRTDLIRDGVLVGLLSHWYETARLLADPALGRKLGAGPSEAARALVPRNGFRLRDGVRSFASTPGTSATNVFLAGAAPVALDELIARVGDGLYIGRIWYTYPINGLRAGDFTCTVVGDSWVIRDGRLAAPLKANAIRVNDNVVRLLEHVIGVGREATPTVVWAADEVVYAPAVAVIGVHVDEIADFMDGLR